MNVHPDVQGAKIEEKPTPAPSRRAASPRASQEAWGWVRRYSWAPPPTRLGNLFWGDKWLLRKVPTSLCKCDFTLYSKCLRNLQLKTGTQTSSLNEQLLVPWQGERWKNHFSCPFRCLSELSTCLLFQPDCPFPGHLLPLLMSLGMLSSLLQSSFSAFPAWLKCHLLLEALQGHPFSSFSSLVHVWHHPCCSMQDRLLDQCLLNFWDRWAMQTDFTIVESRPSSLLARLSWASHRTSLCLCFATGRRVRP